jgi:hypothetical protein
MSSESLLYELRLNGFIVLRDFLPRDFIEALKAQVQPLVLGYAERVAQGDTSIVRGRNRVSIDLKPYAKLLAGALEDARLRRHPMVTRLLDTVMGSWREGSLFAECPLPGSEYMTWHPDTDDAFLSRPLRTERMTFNVPLGDVNDSNAPMQIIPGSHRLHHHDVAEIYRIPQVHAVSLLTRTGDCILRDGNALHRGTPNLTAAPRIMLGQTYRLAETGNPAPEETPSLQR